MSIISVVVTISVDICRSGPEIIDCNGYVRDGDVLCTVVDNLTLRPRCVHGDVVITACRSTRRVDERKGNTYMIDMWATL